MVTRAFVLSAVLSAFTVWSATYNGISDGQTKTLIESILPDLRVYVDLDPAAMPSAWGADAAMTVRHFTEAEIQEAVTLALSNWASVLPDMRFSLVTSSSAANLVLRFRNYSNDPTWRSQKFTGLSVSPHELVAIPDFTNQTSWVNVIRIDTQGHFRFREFDFLSSAMADERAQKMAERTDENYSFWFRNVPPVGPANDESKYVRIYYSQTGKYRKADGSMGYYNDKTSPNFLSLAFTIAVTKFWATDGTMPATEKMVQYTVKSCGKPDPAFGAISTVPVRALAVPGNRFPSDNVRPTWVPGLYNEPWHALPHAADFGAGFPTDLWWLVQHEFGHTLGLDNMGFGSVLNRTKYFDPDRLAVFDATSAVPVIRVANPPTLAGNIGVEASPSTMSTDSDFGPVAWNMRAVFPADADRLASASGKPTSARTPLKVEYPKIRGTIVLERIDDTGNRVKFRTSDWLEALRKMQWPLRTVQADAAYAVHRTQWFQTGIELEPRPASQRALARAGGALPGGQTRSQ